MHLWQHMTPDNCDTADGTEYNKLNINFLHSSSLTCNADGIPVFSSSNSTLWSVYFTIKEPPVIFRHIHMMLNALRTGKCKPRMDTVLHCLRQSSVENMSNVGFHWSKNAAVLNTKVYMCLLSANSITRAPLQNIKQFNGGVWLRVVSESGIHDKQRTWSSSCLYSKVWRKPLRMNTDKYCRSCITVSGGRKMHFGVKVSTG